MPFPPFHPYTRRSMSNGDVAYSNRFFYLRVPPRQVSPPVISNDNIRVDNLEPGCANAPIEIFDGSSDETASTDCIDPSLRRDSLDLGARIPTPGPFNHSTPPVVQTAPPGLVPTQPAAPVETDIPVPALNKPGAPPGYAAVSAPRPFLYPLELILPLLLYSLNPRLT
ncbi:hypothetical protein PCANC_13725 [Puccinia coronata f. sp. avenae]|uniref:Uncharacterized protein n=1 Tax=Puccinia coronata f. sp. avenae TaxID=200324 RepID=A0A2N5T0Z5_9BASI|nr:hypothetical protein PCANC_16148 [Puccinia coronata f. sp. avenae]PLW48805.1 hypothetical protein PCANC_13725 [Puccinia coronata f. sp. avenae]